MKKLIEIVSSMRFAIFVLVVLFLTSIIGTVIPQNLPGEFYLAEYEKFGSTMLFLKFDQVYTSWWYILIGVFLSLSIFFCIVVKVKPIINIVKSKRYKEGLNYIGLWLLHLGLIVIVLFFVLGNATAYQNSMYNVKDSITYLEDIGLNVEIEDFYIDVIEDDHIDQYTTEAKFFDSEDRLIDQGSIYVNHPMTVKGYQFSQASFGYYVDTIVRRDGEEIGVASLIEEEYISADDNQLIIKMERFYPDVVEEDGEVFNKSKIIRRPMVEYTAYLGTIPLKTELKPIDEIIQIGKYEVEFVEPDYYPILDIRKDKFEVFTGIGALLFMVGTVLVFSRPKGGAHGSSTD